MKNPYVVSRLLTMLRVWEQMLFAVSAGLRAEKLSFGGVLKNWPNLRRAVLDRSKPFNESDFEIPDADGSIEDKFFTNKGYQRVPSIVAEWSRCSRRVYQLSKDTQIDLELTTVGGITWADLHPPFPCFIVKLAIPLKGLTGNMIDTIVVQVKSNMMFITALGDELDSFKSMPHELKNLIATASRSGNLAKTHARLCQAEVQGYLHTPEIDYCWDDVGGAPNKEIFVDNLDGRGFKLAGTVDNAEFRKNTARVWVPIFRIVIGLCTELGNPNSDHIVSTEQYPSDLPFTEDQNAITSTGELMNVNLGYDLTADERTIHDLIREYGSYDAIREIGVGFRGAHRRRWPGTGHDDTAPWNVKVRWSIVNEKRLPEKALPQGTCVTV